MQEVDSNNVDREEPSQNKKEKQSLQDQLQEVKKNFMLLKKVIQKMIIQVAAKICTPETR